MKKITMTIESCRTCPYSHGTRGEFCKILEKDIGWQKVGVIHKDCPLLDVN